jgi:putative addiction module killer protein
METSVTWSRSVQVIEMRIHFWPGYRIYFTVRKGTIILLLCGGDKRTQDADIRRAQQMVTEI